MSDDRMIHDDNQSFDVLRLTQVLERASLGVLRVRVGSGLSSGWLITPTLVIVPAHVISQFVGGITCWHSENHATPADLVFRPEHPDLTDVALLRLREPIPGTEPLSPAQKTPADGSVILVLHHPRGMPRQQVTFGRLAGVEPRWLRHDAATGPGSSGGPILDSNGGVLGMTTQRTQDRRQEGPTLAAMFAALRPASMWPEIRSQYRLVDRPVVGRRIATSRTPPVGHDLTFAAVRWTVDSATLSPETREQLAPLVADTAAETWVLRSAERERLVAAAGSLGALRAARGSETVNGPRQAVIDRILQGPPYDLTAEPEESLPYWLQAVRWFTPAVPGLPTPVEVNRLLERRRLRSRLTVVAGPGFRGRDEELSRLGSWYDRVTAGPMVVTGIGGIGKSALVARFAAGLPEQTLLCWLDFDRADLAPDDADSVLSLLGEQMAVQIDFTPPTADDRPWRDRARALGAVLAERPASLLVLDGFEVAQHVREHGEIWPVLETVLKHAPSVRVVVSGRSGIPGLTLRGVEAQVLPVEGLPRAEAEAWLREHDVTEPDVLNRVLDLAHGIPLALRLAVRYLDSGGAAGDLPETLPKALVEGLLYTRVLERVMDPALISIAWDALVLRRLTVEVLDGVLHDDLPEGLSAADVFERLAYELALVSEHADHFSVAVEGPPDELTLRPEVRTATLTLLALDNADRMRAVDERAAAWYARQDLSVPANRAELIYHRLRLDDRAGAGVVWTDDVAPLLIHAEEEIPAAAARWLTDRFSGPAQRTGSAWSLNEVIAWEHRALDRMRSTLARDLKSAAFDVLMERPDRSPDSPLVFYDAWFKADRGDVDAARRLLAESTCGDPFVARDRDVLQAWLSARMGDRATTERLLSRMQVYGGLWLDQPHLMLPLLAVWAARVRLTVDLQVERHLLNVLNGTNRSEFSHATKGYLRPRHVMMRDLADVVDDIGEVPFTFQIPAGRASLHSLEAHLQQEVSSDRWRSDPWGWPETLWQASDAGEFPHTDRSGWLDREIVRDGLDLAVLGTRRWRLAVSDDYALSYACAEAVQAEGEMDPLSISIATTVAAFRSQPLTFRHGTRFFGSVDEILDALLVREGHAFKAADHQHDNLAEALLLVSQGESVRNRTGVYDLRRVRRADLRSVLLYLLGPDPLEMLFRHVAGLPRHRS